MGRSDPVTLENRDRPVSGGPLALPDGFHVIPWRDLDLAALEPAWLALADRASTPNPFFEPWYLRPSLQLFDPHDDVHLALFVESGELAGLIPLQPRTRYHSRPFAHMATWLHANCFCGSPLVAIDRETAFWSACLGWCDIRRGKELFLHLPQLPTDDALVSALKSVCRTANRSLRQVLREKRALLASDLSPDGYLKAAVSTKRRKELRRQRNRLAEHGQIAIVRRRDEQDIGDWIDLFLELEARGWKGKERSALSSQSQTETLFRTTLAEAARMGKLERLSLTLDGRPIAMLATFLSGRAGFSFKTAYDEAHARYSPGLQLQLANLDLLDDPGMDWCDSCAAQDHSMIAHLWRERREIAWLSVPLGRGPRRLAGEAWTALEEWQWRRKA